MPEVLDLSTNYEETAEFLQELRSSIVRNWTSPPDRHRRRARQKAPVHLRSYWDFALIKKISVPVALMIASEFAQMSARGMWMPGAVNYEKWDPKVRAMLQQVGFLAMSGVTAPVPTFVPGNGWKLMRLQSGAKADGQRVDELLRALGVNTIAGSPALYEAIIEALANTRHHAYPKGVEFPEPHLANWWMTGAIDTSQKTIGLVVYDHGVSIPVTLSDPKNQWSLLPKWQRIMRRITGVAATGDPTADGLSIAAAIKVGATSTQLPFRGRGLQSFEAALSMCRDGQIFIRSRSGEYWKQKGRSPSYRSRYPAINGTLITWRLEM